MLNSPINISTEIITTTSDEENKFNCSVIHIDLILSSTCLQDLIITHRNYLRVQYDFRAPGTKGNASIRSYHVNPIIRIHRTV